MIHGRHCPQNYTLDGYYRHLRCVCMPLPKPHYKYLAFERFGDLPPWAFERHPRLVFTGAQIWVFPNIGWMHVVRLR